MFCDIVGYSSFVKNNKLKTVIEYIDDFYTKIDMIVNKYKVNKVETIGDAYLIVSEDLEKILNCSFSIIETFDEKVRIGIDYGEAAGCTLGICKLRYAYVGNVVNVASRLESTSIPGKIHISERIYKELEENEENCKSNKYDYNLIKREEEIELKNIGKQQTYFIQKM